MEQPQPVVEHPKLRNGERFGKWTVQKSSRIFKGEQYYSVLCDCGRLSVASVSSLLLGLSKSCGCMGPPRLPVSIGVKYGMFTVKAIAPRAEKPPFLRYVCVCECGNTITLPAHKLINGLTKSCGCLPRGPREKSPGHTSAYQLWSNYKFGAKRRKLEFTLTCEELEELCQLLCHYCGAEPSQIIRRNNKTGHATPFIYNGLDRVNNKEGYTLSNVVPACWMCNHMKKNRSPEEFLSHVTKIAAYQAQQQKILDNEDEMWYNGNGCNG